MVSERLNPAGAFCASRCWTAEQLGAGFFRHCRQPTRAATAFLRRGIQNGWYASAAVDCCPPDPLSEPLYVGHPFQEPESYHRLAYIAERRRSVPSTPQRVYWATPKFSQRYGSWAGEDQLSRPELASHDLLLSAVWLVYLREHPEIALRHWKSEQRLQQEHRLRKRLPSIPDALIVTPKRSTAVEVLGRYPAEWIAHHCRRFRQAGWHVAIW